MAAVGEGEAPWRWLVQVVVVIAVIIIALDLRLYKIGVVLHISIFGFPLIAFWDFARRCSCLLLLAYLAEDHRHGFSQAAGVLGTRAT